ncbi:HlyIII-domain-containing protein [Piedraia hortae CBS 480.64]|uniref:HlyIII-domain-containing protein n=1 Tax=Piedraia hortae CBS 480.64 TaxID=1314780 RepID=A0A6A7C0K7_9PEZI|nr:HlyIII-domain-containing protein [Piedraia hortae CBS 480.64]
MAALVDMFVTDLGRRLEMIEAYGHDRLDSGMKFAHETLRDVHSSCAHVRDEVVDAGRRRAAVLVATLEEHCNDALARKGDLESKVRAGIDVCEATLARFEASVYSSTTLSQAHGMANDVLDSMEKTVRRAKDSLSLRVDRAIAQARHGLITYDMLPEPWRVNPHILHGYRFSETPLECVRSVFGLHNEAFNIWSHFIGLIVVLCTAFWLYPSTPAYLSSVSKTDIFIAGCFFFAAAKCLVCSTLWHAMSSISNQSLMERFACVDYTGISLLVAASILTTEYTAFYCEPLSRNAYMITTIVLGGAGTVLPWHPTFNRADMNWARVGFYSSLAATGFIPVLQLIYERGWEKTIFFYAPLAKSVVVYSLGACMYASKIPERWLPGRFDYVGGSHNLWHLAVLGGILFHYTAMIDLFRWAFERAETC